MGFQFSKRSLARLEGVHPDLVRVCHSALEISRHDFMVTDGLRTLARQRDLVRRGLSQTLNSRHLTGHAVDLAGWHKGQAVWDWPVVLMIADAMIAAARAEAVPIRWGGAWHMQDARGWNGDAEDLMSAYVAIRRAEGRRPFLDGPHFELPSSHYDEA